MNQVAVIGLGRFGVATSLELMRLGNTVIGIDTDAKLVNEMADYLSVSVVADATNESSLKELDIANCDAVVVAIGESLEASILCVLALKNLGIKEMWVKATSQPHHTILSRLGVSRIIHPEEEMGVRAAQSINYPMVNQYMPIGRGIYLVEVEIKEHCHDLSIKTLLGKATSKIEPLLIRRRNNIIKNIDINSLLETGDSLVLTGEMSALKKIAPEFIAK